MIACLQIDGLAGRFVQDLGTFRGRRSRDAFLYVSSSTHHLSDAIRSHQRTGRYRNLASRNTTYTWLTYVNYKGVLHAHT